MFEGRLSGGIPNSNPNSQEHGDSQIVAVKTLKKRESNLEFLKEAKTASALKHDNIVDLIGVCIESNFIILELMEGGDLLSYLKDMRRYVIFQSFMKQVREKFLIKVLIYVFTFVTLNTTRLKMANAIFTCPA